jgi:hypothetical protein
MCIVSVLNSTYASAEHPHRTYAGAPNVQSVVPSVQLLTQPLVVSAGA